MAGETKPPVVPGAESKDTPPEVKPAEKPVTPKETVGDLLKPGEGHKEETPKMVPEAALIQIKKDNKAMKKDIARLESQIASGATDTELNTNLDALSKEHNVNRAFLDKLVTVIKGTQKKSAAAPKDEDADDADEPVKPAAEPAKAKVDVDKVFGDNFDKTIESMPEYKGIADKEVIKTLALDPKNANKTFSQIIESAYGHLLPGKRSMESARPKGGQDDGPVDMERATKDTKYFQEVMKDPARKAEYNKNLSDRLKAHL